MKMSWLKSCNITRSKRCYWCEASHDIDEVFKPTGRKRKRKKNKKTKHTSFFFQKNDTETESFVVLFQKVNVAEKITSSTRPGAWAERTFSPVTR